jgi:hypothetical protein
MIAAGTVRLCVGLVAAGIAAGAIAGTVDGPYVIRGAQGGFEAWTVESDGAAVSRHATPVAVGTTLTIPAVGSLPAFKVTLRGPSVTSGDVVTVAASAPLFVVADTHGEFEILVDMLRAQRVVDAKLGWSFGRGHLVVLGDVLDRGANQLEILWLLYELEARARKAGGAVHLLLGNHETMVMRGDLRYMNPKYAHSTQVLGAPSYSRLFDAGSVLGQWLRTRPAMLRIDDLLFLHGGVSRELLERKLPLSAINDGVRAALEEQPPFSPAQRERVDFLLGPAGPLWYRGYFAEHGDAPAATAADVDLALAQFGVKRILVGHTIVPTITPLYDGRVIAVQVYPAHDAAGHDHFEALAIRNGKMLRARPDGSDEVLPGR